MAGIPVGGGESTVTFGTALLDDLCDFRHEFSEY